MTIDLKLSNESIANAIREIEKVKQNIEIGIADFVDIACQDGADTANEAYGGMATAYGHREKDEEFVSEGYIKVTADTDEQGIIAEFGAGYATMSFHPWAEKFEKLTGIEIEPISYSRKHYGLLWATDLDDPGHGYWDWGMTLGGRMTKNIHKFKSAFGVKMDRVQPRHGLLNARDFIYWNGTDIAREVIRL